MAASHRFGAFMKRLPQLLPLPGRDFAENDYQEGEKHSKGGEFAGKTRYFSIRLQAKGI
jgi:hypothetical protein